MRFVNGVLVLGVVGVLGCGAEAEESKAGAPKADEPARAAEPAPPDEDGPEGRVLLDDAGLPDCVDGEELRQALMGPAMRACAESVSLERAAELNAPQVDFALVSLEWTAEERGACATACKPWMDELASLVVPDCADDPGFARVPGGDVLALALAGAGLRVGAVDPAQHRAVAEALLTGADAAFSLGRGNTLGPVVGVGTHLLAEHDRWVTWVDAATPASRNGRETVAAAVPTAEHRWEVYKHEIRSVRPHTSRDTFEGHPFVLIDAPRFTDEAFDTRKVPRAIWDGAIDALLEVRCEADWDVCEASVREVPKHLLDEADKDVMKELFQTPGRFADLNPSQHDALQASLRARAAEFFIVGFGSESLEIARLRRDD